MKREIAVNPAALRVHLRLRLAGTICDVRTNSEILGRGLRSWLVPGARAGAADFSLQVLITGRLEAHPAPPHFRGLKHIVIASFGPGNLFTFDLARRNVVAAISEQMAIDHAFWDRILLPIAMGVLGPALGVVPVHCACLAIENAGLLIAGESGAGKSTLSVALAQAGFDFVSDDWTYLAMNGAKLVAHGLSVPAKLLPDAIGHFPLLAHYALRPALNQELAYEVPAHNLGAQVLSRCEPRWFLFLERTADERCSIEPMSIEEGRRYIEGSIEPLPPELEEIRERRSSIIAHVPRLSCWKLRYSGAPTVAVRALQEFRTRQRQEVPA